MRDARRRDHPRQHVSPAPAARRRSDRARSAGCTRFMGWDRPILTDSGGYQVFSLADAAHSSTRRASSFSRISTDSALSLTPESAVDIQARLGLGRRDDVRRVSELAGDARRGRSRDGADAAVGAPRPRSVPRARRRARRRRAAPDARAGAVRHHPGRHLQGPARPERGRHASRSASRPTRSAGCRSASRSRRCTTSSPTRPPSCRTTGRAI